MEAQVTRLKINATNLRNSLVGYNKQLSKLRAEESRIIFNSQRREIQKRKEESVEKKGGIGSAIGSLQSRIMSGPLGFFDKVKEFFGVVLLGLLINNLPKIINGLKKFFKDNAWLIKVVKVTLDIIGKGIMGMIYLVDEYPAAVMKAIDNERRWVAKEIDRVTAIAEGAYSIWNNFLNPPQTTPDPVSGGGGPLGGPLPKVTPPGPAGSTASPSPQPAPGQNQPQKLNKGGTVKNGAAANGPKFRGVNPTPAGSKAIQSISTFDDFSKVALQTELNTQLLSDRDGVNETFKVVNETFGTFLKFFKETGKNPNALDQMNPGSTRSGVPDPFAQFTPVDVSPEDVVGRIGSTGESTGPHLHIETGDGYSGKGGKLSESILNGVFIGGTPLKNMQQGDGLGAGRNHKGFDFPAPSGTPITLGNGLKFVEYDAGYNAGYGNSLIVLDANGNKYLLGHLSGGPTAEALEKIKKAKKKKDPVAAKASELTKALEESVDLSNPAETTTFVMSQMFIQPTPILYPVVQKVGQKAVNMFTDAVNLSPLW